jgi:hypothetical protein
MSITWDHWIFLLTLLGKVTVTSRQIRTIDGDEVVKFGKIRSVPMRIIYGNQWTPFQIAHDLHAKPWKLYGKGRG